MSYKLLVDTGDNVGNSKGADNRGRLHTKCSNDITEPIPVLIVGSQLDDTAFVTCSENTISGGGFDLLTYTVDDAIKISVDNIIGSTTGSFKCEVDYSLDGSTFNRIGTRFSTATPGIDFEIPGLNLGGGGIVKIKRTNLGPSGDFISTSIMGKIMSAGELLTEDGFPLLLESGESIEL
jgi:hypothetical protein